MELREVTYLAIGLRIFSAVLLGGLMGLERGLKNRPAGMRTYMLVCVGACLIMLTNQYIFQMFGSGDPVRMGAQVISGIGFLGAGTIIVTRRNQIKGLTTAAGLWTSAGVGLALGIGFYEAAIAGAVAVFFVMTLLQSMDNRMHRKARSVDFYLELDAKHSLGDIMRKAQELELDITNIQREQDSISETGTRSYVVAFKSKKRRPISEILAKVQSIDGVVYTEEL